LAQVLEVLKSHGSVGKCAIMARHRSFGALRRPASAWLFLAVVPLLLRLRIYIVGTSNDIGFLARVPTSVHGHARPFSSSMCGSRPTSVSPSRVGRSAYSRAELQTFLFHNLDSDGDGRLNLIELRRFAQHNGFEGNADDWKEEFRYMCPSGVCDLAKFRALLEDDEEGCYASDEELSEMIMELPALRSPAAQPAPAPAAAPSFTPFQPGEAAKNRKPPTNVGLQYFGAEREKGLYDFIDASGNWKEWDPDENYRARSPRIGKANRELEDCPFGSSSVQTMSYLNDLMEQKTFGHEGLSKAGSVDRLGALMAMDGTGAAFWTSFLVDEYSHDTDTLEDLTLAPEGWKLEHESIPQGYLMHILSVGNGNRATCFGGENEHMVKSIHRDVSREKPFRLTSAILCSVTGRKRAILFAPDEFPSSGHQTPRNPLYGSSEKLRPILELPEDEAWQAMEDLAQRDDVIGGVLNLEPGNFVFIPHGWWHAVKPIDEFAFVTGPCHAADIGPTEEPG